MSGVLFKYFPFKRSQNVLCCCAIIAFFISASQSLDAQSRFLYKKDRIFESFESSSYTSWEVQGQAFDSPLCIENISDSLLIKSVEGDYLACSLNSNKAFILGKLISPIFRIKHRYIDFKIGGGNHPTRSCINLIIDNKVVRSQHGFNLPYLQSASWDVSDFIGQKASIEIVDAHKYYHIMVDDIIFSNHHPKPSLVFDDFESGEFKKWTVEGESFKMPMNPKEIYYPITVNGYQGNFCAFSFGEKHDYERGRLTSIPFIIDHNYISFLIAGGNHPDSTCISLMIDDSVFYSVTGQNTGEFQQEIWNTTQLKGKEAQIRIVDQYSGNWGHIMIDNICFTDVLNETMQGQLIQSTKNRRILLFSIILLVLLASFWGLMLKDKRHKSRKLSHSNARDFKKMMIALLEDEKLFLHRDLSAKDVAKKCDLTSAQLAQRVEAVFGLSFIDLVNEYRVSCFKKEVLRPENKELKLIAIAEKCGFSSKSSFYRTFKKHTKQTPSEYLQNHVN